MAYERDPAEPTNPAELIPVPQPILSIETQQWYPDNIEDCHQVIRGLAADLAGQIHETQKLVAERDKLKAALAYFTQTA